MPERQCIGCTRQEDWGCNAYKWREPNEETRDERSECWINPSVLPVTFDGEDSFACPRQHIRTNPQYWNTILRYYGMFKRGFLPQEGAASDQSNKAVDIFNILDAVNQDCDTVLQEKQQKNNAPGKFPVRR